MDNTVRTYTDQLVWELRKSGVSGEVIGDAVAQIESHCSDSGEDPRIAFGPAEIYAATFCADVPTEHSWLKHLPHGLAGFVLAALMATALTLFIRDDSPIWGVVAVISCLALVGYGVWLVISQRRRIHDPRKDLSW